MVTTTDLESVSGNTVLQERQSAARPKFTCIKVSRDAAELLRIYCLFNNQRISDYVDKVVERDLSDFKMKVRSLRES